jgi:Protein of unknown function (DUF3341)
MTHRTVQGVFAREADLLRAAELVNQQGWRIVDIYTPYPVHDAARLMGLGRSRLPYAAFAFGAVGVGLAFWFQFWVSALDWPINVGGRPWNSLPAFVPVAFEMMVLFAGLGVVLTWLLVSRLYPGKAAVLSSARVTDDSFVLEVQGPGPESDLESLRQLFRECHARGFEERETR